jgi:regulator of protease activity HflC (stomatin/prohibitin superfamily)
VAAQEAMNEINAAQRMRQAAMEKAEAQKVAVVKAAEADAEAKYLGGLGIARQRQAIINGLRESVKEFSDAVNGVTSRDAMELMLITQYFDMLKEVGAHNKSSTLFLPHGPGNLGDITAQLRSVFLQAGAVQQMDR